MSAGSKPTSRWGSFLQQAVAGVESRLDNILAEDDSASAAAAKSKPAAPETSSARLNSSPTSAPGSSKSSVDLSRQNSTSRNNDRLQQRLAKAVGSRSGTPKPEEPGKEKENKLAGGSTSSSESRNDLAPPQSHPTLTISPSEPYDAMTDGLEEPMTAREISSLASESTSQPRLSMESTGKSDAASVDGSRSVLSISDIGPDFKDEKTAVDPSATLQLSRADYEAAEFRRQEEIHDYIERIDALQAKLQYLAKEATETAKNSAENAASGSVEEKLSRKDEKIALLIEEGQKMSQNELKLMTTIKSLRAKMVENEKRNNQFKQTAEKSEKLRIATQDKLKAAEAAQNERTQRSQRLERDMEKAKADAEAKGAKFLEIQNQMAQAATSGINERLAEAYAALDKERSTVSQLQEEVSTLKIEKKLSEDRQQRGRQDLEESMSREKERARLADVELRAEIAALESRLENYRSQAEEITSSSGSDTQAKLFRQIETLQTQYSVATENWRGIESSLLTRISVLEKDRDELGSKEAELRKKVREASTKTRRIEDDLEQAKSIGFELDEKLSKETSISNTLRGTLEKAQSEAEAARKELTSAKEQITSMQKEMERREREAQNIEMAYNHPHPMSPGITSLKSPVDRIEYERSSSFGRRGGYKDLERPGTATRKPSVPFGFGAFSTRTESQLSMALSSSKESLPSRHHSPSRAGDQQDDMFDAPGTPATPDKTINDMLSASTAAAGPSVQLVERMSAAVRRLEAEKAASKDEIDRIQSQRDEAREQVVSLMQEVEEKRNTDSKIAALETEVATLDQRYQTTLEMLGEKSERVEELQADIADMKQIYRDALEKSVR